MFTLFTLTPGYSRNGARGEGQRIVIPENFCFTGYIRYPSIC
jgi:hypothetical protein